MEKIYTVAEARAYLKVSDATIRRYIRSGKLPSQRIGRQHRITESSIEAFLKSQNDPKTEEKTVNE